MEEDDVHKTLLLAMAVALALASCSGSSSDEGLLDSAGTDAPLYDSSSFPDDLSGAPDAEEDDSFPPRPDVPDGPPEDIRHEPIPGPCSTLQPAESLADLETSYSPANWKQALLDVLDRRYAPGHYILTQAKDQSQLQAFVKTGSFQDLVMSASVAVHEMNHLYGWELSGWSNYAYFLCPEQILKVASANTPPRNVVATLLDESVGNLVATYADIYLTGMMGSQGFWTLLDELNAYTHSIFLDYQLLDRLPQGMSISSLDGLTTFMLFTELYLKWVRTNQPAQYDAIVNGAGVRETILAVWDRAEWIIAQTETVAFKLSLDADGIQERVFDTEQ